MDREVALVVQREKRSVAQFEGFVNELLGSLLYQALAISDFGFRISDFNLSLSRLAGSGATAQAAGHDFNVVFAEAIQPQSLVRRVNLSVGSHLGIAMLGCPISNIGMEAF